MQIRRKKNLATSAGTIKDSTKYIRILDPEALGLIDSAADIEVISRGYKWSEGPVYVSDSDYLLFSDVPANRIYKWKEGSGTSLYLEPSGSTGMPSKSKEPGSNGLVIDKNGKLVLCQQGYRQIGRMKTPLNDPKPEFEALLLHTRVKSLIVPTMPYMRQTAICILPIRHMDCRTD